MEALKWWKIGEFPKILMKNFYEVKIASHLKKSFIPHQPNKNFYVSRTKIFLRRFTRIYRHLLSKSFENAVFGWKEMVQWKCFIWYQPETGVLENLLQEYISYNVDWDDVCKMMFFERNCIVMWVIFVATFVGFETLPENLKLIGNNSK